MNNFTILLYKLYISIVWKEHTTFSPFGLLLLAVPQLCSSLFMYKTEIKARLLMPYLVHSLQQVTEPDHSVSSEYMQELKPPQVWWECWYTLSKWNANKSLISKALKFPAYHPASSRAFKHLYNQSSYLCFLNNAKHWNFLSFFLSDYIFILFILSSTMQNQAFCQVDVINLDFVESNLM